jgi:putative two-component system response regulator
MSRFSWAVARRLGLPRAEAEDIQYAAPMHDIGKIGIPDRILLKPGKLDPDEWEIMRQHSTIGASILEGSDIPFIQLAERVARSHHEKWDGTGYPASLAGERIPLPARIVAVADVFDAVTCHRPYRKNPMPVPEALDLIRKGRGSHFDPAVVDAFFAVQDEVLAIKDQFRDGDESRFLLMANRAEANPPAPA